MTWGKVARASGPEGRYGESAVFAGLKPGAFAVILLRRIRNAGDTNREQAKDKLEVLRCAQDDSR